MAERTEDDDPTTDVRLIERRTDIPSTTKEMLIQARRGQGKFRKGLETLWAACPISGLARRELLRASHIMPWRAANDDQRLSKFNGILLSANFDALFDKHLISFEDDGTLMVSAKILQVERSTLGLDGANRIKFKPQHKSFLAHHRGLFLKTPGNLKAGGRRA